MWGLLFCIMDLDEVTEEIQNIVMDEIDDRS